MIDRSSGRAVPEIDVLEGSVEVKARDAGACAADSNFTIPGVQGEFCKKCSTESEAPIDGVCGATTAVTGATCGSGVCTVCGTGNYFLFNGGCYDQTKEPGSKLCGATPTNGVCGTAASGAFVKDSNLYLCNDATNGGKENCGTCTYASNAFTCSECLEGHHSSSSSPVVCTKCTLPNCVSYPDSKDVCTTCLNGFQGYMDAIGPACGGEEASTSTPRRAVDLPSSGQVVGSGWMPRVSDGMGEGASVEGW
ncbi:High cysteine protein [Giardia muris]|uniref:High cysteine protein n=1 Tax=Giardia muris TaxID=5742 RepID=A0A4Z1TBQ2_GIAMU|nr:High cysteine protein [Giardia muris]|eukprot:TNJ29951.1 High cysteine protein [Giardia muris]